MAYIEAMAGGLPAIGCRGEPGPEEIAAAGDGFMLVPPGDIERLTQRIDELLSDPHRLREASQRARATVAASFTWERCGEQTLAAYEHALRWTVEPRRPVADLDDTAPIQTKPVLFVTGHAPPDRVGAFARLHEARERRVRAVRRALQARRPAPRREPRERRCPSPTGTSASTSRRALAASGRYRAVVCSTGGRIALGATWAGARRAGLPLILWSALWAHPRSAAHALSFLALRRLYRSADAVVTYGPHVSAYVRARGARNVHIAPQAVDNAFWSAADIAPPRWPTVGAVRGAGRPGWPEQAATKFLFVGRPAREKGLRVLTEAWRTTGLQAPTAALVLVGVGSNPPWVPAGGAAGDAARTGSSGWTPCRRSSCATCTPPATSWSCRRSPHRTFREPWGLVVNEAMNRGLPVIATDAVGAAAGGLVRDGHNGLVVPAGDSDALAGAIRRLAADPALRARLGEAGAQDVRAFTYDAWAAGFSGALASLGLSRDQARSVDHPSGVSRDRGRRLRPSVRLPCDLARERW